MGLTKFMRRRAAAVMAPVTDEVLYFEVFRDRLRALDLPLIYRPFGAGANASLLFLIVRLIELHRPARVLDLGGGQSTLLLDALSDRFPMTLQTVESDPGWRDDLAARVRHDVRLCPAETRRHDGHAMRAYALPDDVRAGPYDLILVDGPGGARRFGRVGALDVIPAALTPGGVVVFDDTHRPGERETAALAESRIAAAHGPVRRLTYEAKGAQVLLAPAAAPWLSRL
ncbi:class I SAM-dependent methyltransferase [Roseospira navarrensis]|uniref:Class I SAM-dependent methyltransferase n=1 Tax=Roseospira navarrensis TaxID=140058 RepID=A0A7X1ZEJ0_9PROT|nr:class I SAM-dependent methyltransferase [Roseospira navarrensis]MQX37108.1 hypothetical protein [Roseospira navarrensis]